MAITFCYHYSGQFGAFLFTKYDFLPGENQYFYSVLIDVESKISGHISWLLAIKIICIK